MLVLVMHVLSNQLNYLQHVHFFFFLERPQHIYTHTLKECLPFANIPSMFKVSLWYIEFLFPFSYPFR